MINFLRHRPTLRRNLSELDSLQLWLRSIRVAWNNLRASYNRTYLGPLWLTVGMGAFIVAKGMLFGKIFAVDQSDFIPYLGVGIITWYYMAGIINGACNNFVSRRGMILNLDLPIQFFIMLQISEVTLLFFHNALIIPPLLIYFSTPVSTLYLVPIGMLILLVTSWSVGSIISVLGAQFRDFGQLVHVIMRVMFFMTPVFWHREKLGDNVWFADINPFYHFVEVIRAPILGDVPSGLSYLVTLIVMVLGLLVSRYQLGWAKSKVAFWV